MAQVTGTENSDFILVGFASDGVDPATGTTGGTDQVTGLGGDDWIFGGGQADLLDGGAGNDVIDGGDGNDQLEGGDDNDVLRGGMGLDFLNSGSGDDYLDGGEGIDSLDGGGGNDVLFGGQDNDILTGGADNDALFGGEDDDGLFGGSGTDTLDGGDGDDDLNGGDDHDDLDGGAGEDILQGGAGDDRLVSGGDDENDTLQGGFDDDTFVFSGNNGSDTIVDFTDGSEQIDFTAYNVSDVNDFDITANRDNTVISGYSGVGGDITLQNFAPGDLSNDDFIFADTDVPAPEPPVLSIGPAVVSQAEGDFGTTEYTFNVMRDGDLSQASAVFVTFDAGDTDSSDFGGDLPDPILVLFQADEDEQSVTYLVSGDFSIEDDETFTVSLETPVGATIDETASSAVGTITNDDAAPPATSEISIGPAVVSQAEGDFGTTEYTFNVTRDGEDLSKAAAVLVTFDAGDTDSNDFGGDLPDPILVLFEADIAEQEVTYLVSGDLSIEADETFTVSLDMPVGATIDETASSAVGTITNDDEGPPANSVISIGPAVVSQAEGDFGTTEYTFNVTRDGEDLSKAAAVLVTFDAGDTDSSDFGGDLPDPILVLFEADIAEQEVTYSVSGDLSIEADETFTVSLDMPVGATIDETASSAVGTIVNDDELPPANSVISIGPAVVSQAEGDFGTTEYTFNVTRTGDLSKAAAALVTFDAGDTNSNDFGGDLPDAKLVFFGANIAEDSVTYSVSGDLSIEADETFTVSLDMPVGATIDETASSAVGTITNDDEADDEPDLNVIDGTEGPNVLEGTEGNDIIRGFGDNDVLEGGEGNDILLGGNDGDILKGQAGNDILFGGKGEDVLDGGEGNDILNGGARSDLFQFFGDFGNDIVTDFDDNKDGLSFVQAESDSISVDVQSNGTLITVDDEDTFGEVFLLGVTDLDEFNI